MAIFLLWIVSMGVLTVVSAPIWIPIARWAYRRHQQSIRLTQWRTVGMDQIVNMRSYPFETTVAGILRDLGWQVEVTKRSGDGGADILLRDCNGYRVAVQCKGYSKPVGYDAIQQVHTAKTLYHCHGAWVVTNSWFTKPAIRHANELKVQLFDRDWLCRMAYDAKTKIAS